MPRWLKATHAGTGFMHESFNKNDPSKVHARMVCMGQHVVRRTHSHLDKTNPKLLEKA